MSPGVPAPTIRMDGDGQAVVAAVNSGPVTRLSPTRAELKTEKRGGGGGRKADLATLSRFPSISQPTVESISSAQESEKPTLAFKSTRLPTHTFLQSQRVFRTLGILQAIQSHTRLVLLTNDSGIRRGRGRGVQRPKKCIINLTTKSSAIQRHGSNGIEQPAGLRPPTGCRSRDTHTYSTASFGTMEREQPVEPARGRGPIFAESNTDATGSTLVEPLAADFMSQLITQDAFPLLISGRGQEWE